MRTIDLIYALEESLKLQTHYAQLLNSWDGGQRIGFDSIDEWLDRLAMSIRDRVQPETRLGARGRHKAYRSGWIDGAKGSAFHGGHGVDYEDGFNDGYTARLEAMNKASDRLGANLVHIRLNKLNEIL